MIPKKVFLTKGKGFHKNKLHSFELALRNAEIHRCNLVKVSSIIPPKCEIIGRKEGVSYLKPGGITYCVLSVCETNKYKEEIGASIGLSYSENKELFGYIAEGIKRGEENKKLSYFVEKTSFDMLKTILNDENKGYNLKKRSVVVNCIGKKDVWATAVAAAVFIM